MKSCPTNLTNAFMAGILRLFVFTRIVKKGVTKGDCLPNRLQSNAHLLQNK